MNLKTKLFASLFYVLVFVAGQSHAANFVYDPEAEPTGALTNPPWNNITGGIWSNTAGTPNSIQSTSGGANITVIDDGLGENAGEYDPEQWIGGRISDGVSLGLHCIQVGGGAGVDWAVLLDRGGGEARIFTFDNTSGTNYTQRATTSGAGVTDATELYFSYQSGTYTGYVGIDHPDDIGSETAIITYSDTSYATRTGDVPGSPSPCFHEFSSSPEIFFVQGGDVFSSTPSDTTPPVFSVAPAVSSITTDGGTFTATIDETGDIYFVVVADGATAPTSAEVIAGTGSGGSGELATGSATATTTISDAFTGLADGTAFDLYAAAQDDEGAPNVQGSPTLVEFTTQAAASGPTIQSVTSSAGADQAVFCGSSYGTCADPALTVTVGTGEGAGITGCTFNGYALSGMSISGDEVEFSMDYGFQVMADETADLVCSNGSGSSSAYSVTARTQSWFTCMVPTVSYADLPADALIYGLSQYSTYQENADQFCYRNDAEAGVTYSIDPASFVGTRTNAPTYPLRSEGMFKDASADGEGDVGWLRFFVSGTNERASGVISN